MNNDFGLLSNKKGFVGPTFTLSNRLKRFIWAMSWLIFARWSPPPLHRWRIFLLRIFGAHVSWSAYIYPSVNIWAPWHLTIDDFGTLARNVTCYNIAPIAIGECAVVSQGAYLCTGSHDYNDPAFALTARPILIGKRAWVCAQGFVGPGVTLGEGSILSAMSVALRDLAPWSIYIGNPAVLLRERPLINDL
jgi:putative colanic acid biosynthesis acetyltransferase WcaF